MMIIQTRILHEIRLISGGEDWGLEIIFADIQVLVHSRCLALLQLGHQGVFEEVAEHRAGVQAVDHGVLQASRGFALTLERTECRLDSVGWEEQSSSQGLWLWHLACKIFQPVLEKIFSWLPPTCETGGGGHLPEVPRRTLLLEADLLAVLHAPGSLGVGLHHVVQVVLLVVALYVRIVVVEGIVVVVVVAGPLVRFAPSGWWRRFHFLLLPGSGRPLLLQLLVLFVGQGRPEKYFYQFYTKIFCRLFPTWRTVSTQYWSWGRNCPGSCYRCPCSDCTDQLKCWKYFTSWSQKYFASPLVDSVLSCGLSPPGMDLAKLVWLFLLILPPAR